MRLESSLLMSVCTTDGSVPVFRLETVGNDSSSATKGSSMTIVAGKKRDPAKPWANAAAVGRIDNAVARASLRRPFEVTANIRISRIQERGSDRPAAPVRAELKIWRSAKGVALGLERRGAGADRAGQPAQPGLL